MNYWLLKTEPETFSWDDLERLGNSMWGRSSQLSGKKRTLRKMNTGDRLFIYHSGKSPGIVGLAEVIKEHYRDPTAKEGEWSAVDVKPIRKLNRFITLQEIKHS